VVCGTRRLGAKAQIEPCLLYAVSPATPSRSPTRCPHEHAGGRGCTERQGANQAVPSVCGTVAVLVKAGSFTVSAISPRRAARHLYRDREAQVEPCALYAMSPITVSRSGASPSR
jgi:hypothetical protein